MLQAAFLDIMKFHTPQYWGRDKEEALVQCGNNSAEAKAQHLEDARRQFEAIRDEYAKSSDRGIAAIADAAIGEIYLLGNIPHLAERAYWRALREYGDQPKSLQSLARYGICQAKYHRGDYNGSIEQLELFLASFTAGQTCGITVARPQMRGDALIWKVVILNEAGRTDEALSAARLAKLDLEGQPGAATADAISNLSLWEGSILASSGSAEEAAQVLQAVINKNPGTAQAERASSILAALKGGK